ncbi:MAG: phosphohydrolase [Bdellovibrionales bacterium RIFCSPHIGHO2_01_FULL_40_29]|nr:MAG: phosphohydrolase [Bdellovibrionales bacterium RIFCSPHIGHO2_01_FULL_40_29]OFZ34040.1 MAG: phosphohydrolase [Bdellovibrionales bacterium RIFCSPHIGHO2_02_FULL_40_15]
MKRKDWFIVIAVLVFVVLVDQFSKNWASNLPEQWYGALHLILIHNHGAMLGLFSDLPAVLRIVTLSTSGVFLLSIYAIIQYLIPVRLMVLRIGLSILVGGILGNVLDRILYGYVIDFIAVQISSWHSPIWNVADVIQWFGYIMIVYSVIKHGELLWPGNNIRKVFWVNRRFQLKYSALFMSVGLFLTLISLVFSYTYLKVTIEEISGNPILVEKFSTPFLYSFSALAVTFSFVLFFIGKLISHRIAGPLYAFERFLNEILEGKGLTKNSAALKLRAGDDFKHLEQLAEQIKIKLIKMNSEKTVETIEYKED